MICARRTPKVHRWNACCGVDRQGRTGGTHCLLIFFAELQAVVFFAIDDFEALRYNTGKKGRCEMQRDSHSFRANRDEFRLIRLVAKTRGYTVSKLVYVLAQEEYERLTAVPINGADLFRVADFNALRALCNRARKARSAEKAAENG